MNKPTKIPEHIAIIMDGNGRWAKEKGLTRTAGHRAGADRVKEIVSAAAELGVKAQLDGYVTDGLWLRLAGQANGAMRTLADGLAGIDGVRLLYPADANMLFAEFPRRCVAALKKAGFVFYEIEDTGPNGIVVRLVTSFNTDPAHVAAFVGTARDAR